MTYYVRIGNSTVTAEERKRMTSKQIEKVKDDAEKANQKRLENMRKGLGLEPKKGLTLDVTPEGIAARKSAITAEEAKIVEEAKEIEKRMAAESDISKSESADKKENKKTKKGKAKKETVLEEITT